MAKTKSKNCSLRYPLHRGPFLFAPHFLGNAEWFFNFRALIEKVLLDVGVAATIVKPYEGRQILVKFLMSEMMIDGDGGIFSVEQLGNSEASFEDSFFNYWSGPCGAPPQFFEELSQPDYETQIGIDFKNVSKFSSRLYLLMKHRFESAVKLGTARVMANVNSPFAVPTSLEFWQLQYLKPVEKFRESYFAEDRDLDEATGQDGTRIFGLGVEPISPTRIEKPERVGLRGRKPIIDYDKLYNVMLELMRKRGVPGNAPSWTGEQFAEAVRSAFGAGAPGRSTILKNLPLVKQMFKKERSRRNIQQSSNSKIRVN